ncbi:MAG TPA: cupin domain-containing protein [Pseudonocardiaceae bacterium]|jgi:quercetin dioxygenase-like cupin family protein|nr:cupin domain-containing protein [Pseudonocardiaceae bacterium]
MTFDSATARPRLVVAKDLPAATVPGHSFRFVADALDTGGAYSLTEATSPAGAGVPLHAHDSAVECFFVLEGDYRLTVSGRTHDLGAGGFSLVPRGAPHRFTVAGEHTARAVVLFAPAGFEEVFRQMPDIFGTEGEPGPLWAAANALFDTRLLDSEPLDPAVELAGPPAVTKAGPVIVGSDRAVLTPLAGPAQTRTGLSISVRTDPRAGLVWGIGPTVCAAWIVRGSYRLHTEQDTVSVHAGEFFSFDRPTSARAVAAEANSQALLLCH